MPQPQKYTKCKYHYVAPFEVVVHNKPTDCWVSLLGKVFDVTPLIKEFENQDCVKPLIAYAGKDISEWFDENTEDIRHYIHPLTGVNTPYCPHGIIPHVNPQCPATDWKPLEIPWWKDETYQVGLLTKRVRPIKVLNALIFKEVLLNVCCEDTFNRIMERYSIFNSDSSSYTWRYNDLILDMKKTLEENGIIDERDSYTDLGLPQSLYTPMIFIYYKDDFKWEDQ